MPKLTSIPANMPAAWAITLYGGFQKISTAFITKRLSTSPASEALIKSAHFLSDGAMLAVIFLKDQKWLIK